MNFNLLGNLGTAQTLNIDLINKLKESEQKSLNKPIELNIEKIKSKNIKDEVILKELNTLDNFLKNINDNTNNFSLNIQGNNLNIFPTQPELLKDNIYDINISSIAKKDIYKSNNFSSKNDLINKGVININNIEYDTTNKTYQDLLNEINVKDSNLSANIEQVNENEFSLILSSKNSGEKNKIKIENDNMLFTNVQQATNLKGTINGVDFSNNTNSLFFDKIEFNFFQEGKTYIEIKEDKNNLSTQIKDFVEQFNNLKDFSIDSKELQNTLKEIKNVIFEKKDNQINIFDFGIELDYYGKLNINEEKFNSKIKETSVNDLNNFLIGDYENKGLMSRIKELNLSSNFEKIINNDLKTLDKLNLELLKQNEYLDKKYEGLSTQFAQYSSIISTMESSFSSLKLMIEQSKAK